MQTKIKIQSIDISIESTFLGDKVSPWSSNPANYNYHKIVIKAHTLKLSFDFWASIMNPEIQSDEENTSAFYCFVSDALSGEMDFNEFCNEFGYDINHPNRRKIYKACQKSNCKFHRVFDGIDIYDFINELQEKHEC